ncbi:NAD(P)/FAD-dependent oxidoreductase [Amycolatopsis benzoatilytica]|uniref:NAD(P)/FAD-dependent oxidoreductase n=1 Tax=Amycolatopsis benzoatilytica TaxID=346045 RepID=UPI00037ADA68|nr:FAD-dependent oxidoreductase [Amycolatopsis benzoatilytica]
MSETSTITVLGGGYAGTLAANRLRKHPGAKITLVNPRPEFVERIRLHQLVAHTGDATIEYQTLLGDGIELVVDQAVRIDAAARTVQLASGRALEYDYLVYAVGSTGAKPAVPGGAEFAFSIADLESAHRLRSTLDDLPRLAPVTVVGGGLTGIETAAELAEQGRAVTLVCGGALAPTLSAPARRNIANWLEKHGVDVLATARVTEVRPDEVALDDGTARPSAVTVWTAGFGVPGLAAASGLSTDDLGRLITDETLTSVDDDRIVAAGDACAVTGHPARMSTYAASPLGAHAADTVVHRLEGTAPEPFALAFSGSCVSLGRRAGVRQVARRDDTAVNVYVSGRLGAAIKELACRFVVGQRIRLEARKPGAMNWPKSGLRVAEPAASR